MQIRVYIDNKSKILELFNVTYEESDGRFKSLRLSHGHYPEKAFLDYKDQSVEIRNDFIVNPEDLEGELGEHQTHLKTEVIDNVEVLKENWFCWSRGTPVFDIQYFINE